MDTIWRAKWAAVMKLPFLYSSVKALLSTRNLWPGSRLHRVSRQASSQILVTSPFAPASLRLSISILMHVMYSTSFLMCCCTYLNSF